MDDSHANSDQQVPAEEAGKLYTIEISAMKDGTFQVEMDTGAQEAAEESMGDAKPQTASSFSGAMEIANQLSQSADSGDDSFNAGFGKGQAAPTYIREGE